MFYQTFAMNGDAGNCLDGGRRPLYTLHSWMEHTTSAHVLAHTLSPSMRTDKSTWCTSDSSPLIHHVRCYSVPFWRSGVGGITVFCFPFREAKRNPQRSGVISLALIVSCRSSGLSHVALVYDRSFIHSFSQGIQSVSQSFNQ